MANDVIKQEYILLIKHLSFTVQLDSTSLVCQASLPEGKATVPAVLVFPTWAGRDDFVCTQADRLAQMGYVGIAVDIFGEAKVGSSKEENMALITPFMNDRSLLLARMQAVLLEVANLERVNANKISAIGFCFGGLCVLDMARASLNICSVVSLHGLLVAPNESTALIEPSILVLHGHDDPMVPVQQVQDFEAEMTRCQADWQVHVFGQTAHAFTNPHANDPNFGTVYSQLAERRAWQLTHSFLQTSFSDEP